MLSSAVEYIRSKTERPWLVLGKGPTSDLFDTIDAAKYHILTLNHACRVPKQIALAHFVDIEAFHECGDALAQAETAVCLPWYPHAASAAGRKTLMEYVTLLPPTEPNKYQALGWLLAKDLLVSYNASTATAAVHKPHPKLPRIKLRFFSAVGAFNLLAAAGVKTIHSLGVDGGTGYGKQFDAKDRLANGRSTFDDQTSQLLDTCRRNRIQWHKLTGVETNVCLRP